VRLLYLVIAAAFAVVTISGSSAVGQVNVQCVDCPTNLKWTYDHGEPDPCPDGSALGMCVWQLGANDCPDGPTQSCTGGGGDEQVHPL